MTQADAVSRYGVIAAGMWQDEARWCTLLPTPQELSGRVINSVSGALWTRVYCNKDMVRALTRALGNTIDRKRDQEIETFDGCYMIRDVRGVPGQLSAHAYALAIDLNAAKNPLGAKPVWTPEFVQCFTDEGFAWGGNFPRLDGMHFSLAWE